jgi:hypothetical protein
VPFVTSSTLKTSMADREVELAAREAELNRRESQLRRAEEARAEELEGSLARASAALQAELAARVAEVERRERELGRLEAAVQAQRQRLVDVQQDYERRRAALADRSRDGEVECNRLREEQSQLVAASLMLEGGGKPAQPAEPVEAVDSAQPERARADLPRPVPVAAPEPAPARQPRRAEADESWWAKQLGAPLAGNA